MTPETAIRKLLTDNASITALIGTRIYPGFVAEAKAMPFAVINRDSTEPDHHLLGASGLRNVTVELVLYDEQYADLTALADLFEATLDTVNDRSTVTIGGDTFSIARLWMTDQSDETVQLADGKGRKIYSIRQLYELYYHT